MGFLREKIVKIILKYCLYLPITNRSVLLFLLTLDSHKKKTNKLDISEKKLVVLLVFFTAISN
jgi:hypothetical protein